MKTAVRNKHLEFIEPLSDRKITEETYIMVAEMKDNVILKEEFNLYKKITFGTAAVIGIALVKLGIR